MHEALPPGTDSGTYILVMAVEKASSICVGKLGYIEFKPGYYTYVGSARGSGGLAARISRHLRKNKKRFWHIDYMTTRYTVAEVWFSAVPDHKECRWAQLLAGVADEQVERFGASDCRCLSHMFYFKRTPRLSQFIDLVDNNHLSKNRSEIKIKCYLPGCLGGS